MAPFMSATQSGRRIDVARVTEGVLIATITGIIAAVAAAYSVTQTLAQDIQYIQRDISKIERALQRIESDFYAPRVPGQ